MVVGCYYASLVYAHLCHRQRNALIFGRLSTEIIKQQLQKRENIFLEEVSYIDHVQKDRWTVPAPLWAMIYPRDAWYLPANEATGLKAVRNVQEK